MARRSQKQTELLPDFIFSSFEICLNLFLLHFSSEELTHKLYTIDLNIRELRSTFAYLLMGSELSGRQRTLPGNGRQVCSVLVQVVLFPSIPGLPRYSPMSSISSLLTLKMQSFFACHFIKLPQPLAPTVSYLTHTYSESTFYKSQIRLQVL